MADPSSMGKYEFWEWLGFTPHINQKSIVESSARFRCAACGVRFGKSLIASMELIEGLRIPDTRYWVVAPTYDLTEKVFRELYKFIVNSPLSKYIDKESYSQKHISFVWGSEVLGKSGDNPISLAGEALDGVVIDEAPALKEIIWTDFIRQRLTDRKGWAFFIGTPRGRNWYYNFYTRGLDKLDPDYESFHFTSYDNPYLDSKEIDSARMQIPERAFRQEYLAEFLSEEDSVFRHIRDAVKPQCLQRPVSGHNYVAGVDLAKYQDYTVVSIVDQATNEVVFFDRWHRTDWNVTYDRISKAVKDYNNAVVWVDASGIGDPIYETLVKKPYNLRVKPFKFTNTSKGELVDNLAWFFENYMIKIPDEPVLINELEVFEYSITGSGKFTFNAPQGYHDDCVMSLGLACLGLSRRKNQYVGFVDTKMF